MDKRGGFTAPRDRKALETIEEFDGGDDDRKMQYAVCQQ